MERVTGIGGVFFKARDPKALTAWYAKHLGLAPGEGGAVILRAKDDAPEAHTVWSAFPSDTTYFAPSQAPFMVNFRVRDLEAMLAQLAAAGFPALGHEDSEFGRFAWVMDPEGNKVELWQPPTP